MKRILFFQIMVATALAAFAWGQKGHDATAYIAECHLTPTTKATVDSLLSGRSMVYWANWLDNASHTSEYAYTKTWHYKNVDEGVRYEEAQANPAGDVVTAIKAQIETLSGNTVSLPQKELAMKILVHIVGDMHQPMHLGHATDLGGNRVKMRFFNRDTNLHSIWDGSIPESAHKWSYSEWQQQIDRVSPEEEESIIYGSVDDWAKETLAIANLIYSRMAPGSNISYNEVAEWAPAVELQFLRGGLRLAHILNTIFDPAYASAHQAPYTPAQ